MGAIVRAAIWAAWWGLASRCRGSPIDGSIRFVGNRLTFSALASPAWKDFIGQTAALGATEPAEDSALPYSHGASDVAVGWREAVKAGDRDNFETDFTCLYPTGGNFPDQCRMPARGDR
jgi:hypothetical protein